MSVEIVFNELCLQDKIGDREGAKEKMTLFISLLNQIFLMTAQNEKYLRTPEDIITKELTNGYGISHWINDNTVNQELRTFFLTQITSQPYIDNFIEKDYEIKFEDRPAKGLSYAYRNNGFSISIELSNKWNSSHLNIKIINIDELGNIHETKASVKHSSTYENLKTHLEWLKEIRYKEINHGRKLIIIKDYIYPHIAFLGNSLSTIKLLGEKDLKIKKILQNLDIIEDSCSKWNNANDIIILLRDHGITIRPDSRVTIDKYPDERKYTDPYGEPKTFKWHFDINPGAWRGYIDFDRPKKQIYLTYIGPHLNTVKFKN